MHPTLTRHADYIRRRVARGSSRQEALDEAGDDLPVSWEAPDSPGILGLLMALVFGLPFGVWLGGALTEIAIRWWWL